ncbi:MAG: hypothetical protein ACREEY_09060 [Brevundimonas sp.]
MTADHVRETIASLDQEIDELRFAIERMPSDALMDGENWRDLLIQARLRKLQDKAVWAERLKSWQQQA